MKRWALIAGTTIQTVVECADAPAAPGAWVEVTGPFGPGDFYDGGTFTRKPVADDTTFLVDVGPFFDRFEAAQLAVLASANGTVKAFMESCKVRKWIYTKHPFVAQGIDAIIAAGVPGVDAAMKDRIINTPARYSEQKSLLKLYFGG